MAKRKFVQGLALAGALVLTMGMPAMAGNTQITRQKDTVPSQKGDVFDKQLRELDRAMEKLEQQFNDPKWQESLNEKLKSSMEKLNSGKFEAEMEKAMAKLEKQLNDPKWQKDLESSMEQLNSGKLEAELQKAMEKIDLEKMKSDVSKSLEKIDWDGIKQSLKTAFEKLNTDIDFDKLKKEVDGAGRDALRELDHLKKSNREEMRKNMLKAKEDMKKQQSEFEKQKFNIRDEMKKASVEIEKAKAEITGYKSMTEEMAADRLLKTADDYTIEYNQGSLLINGVKQSETVTGKYKKYFKKDKVTIKKEGENLNIR